MDILGSAWFTLLMTLLGVIGVGIIGYMTGFEKGYDKGRRDERIKQYKALQNQKANFIDAD